jgi:hypothetical protein
MVIVGILSIGFVVLAILLVLVRFVFDLRLTAIQQEADHSQLFRRKINHLRKIEQARHIRYLLIICLMIGIGLAILIGSFLVLMDKQQKLTAQNQIDHERIIYLEKQQKQLMANIPLKKYPEEGIGLEEYEWEKWSEEKKDVNLQRQIESAISKRSALYLDAFAKEAEKVSQLNNIHVRMITSVSKEKQVVYSVNYSRKKSEDKFNKQNVSEQNLKNSGEKG